MVFKSYNGFDFGRFDSIPFVFFWFDSKHRTSIFVVRYRYRSRDKRMTEMTTETTEIRGVDTDLAFDDFLLEAVAETVTSLVGIVIVECAGWFPGLRLIINEGEFPGGSVSMSQVSSSWVTVPRHFLSRNLDLSREVSAPLVAS